MKVVYMECTLAIMANIDSGHVENLSRTCVLKQTETMRYLVQIIENQNYEKFNCEIMGFNPSITYLVLYIIFHY